MTLTRDQRCTYRHCQRKRIDDSYCRLHTVIAMPIDTRGPFADEWLLRSEEYLRASGTVVTRTDSMMLHNAGFLYRVIYFGPTGMNDPQMSVVFIPFKEMKP